MVSGTIQLILNKWILYLSQPPKEQFERLKRLAQSSGYESSYLNNLLQYEGADIKTKIDYLISSLQTGEFTFAHLENALKIDNYYTYYDQKSIDADRMKYQISLTLLRELPLPYLQKETNLSYFCSKLFEAKRKFMAYERAKAKSLLNAAAEGEKLDPAAKISIEDIDIFDGKTDKARVGAELDFAFEFLREGGYVRFSIAREEKSTREHEHPANIYVTYDSVSISQENDGADVNIIGLIQELGFPQDLVSTKVGQLLEANKNRYTPGEIDKWISLTAFCKQPDLHTHYATFSPKKWLTPGLADNIVKINTPEGQKQLDFHTFDDVFTIADYVSTLPACSYRDSCLERLYNDGFKKVCQISTTVKQGLRQTEKTVKIDHPRRSDLEAKLLPIFTSGFSPISLGIGAEAKHDIELRTVFIPKSEKYITDLPAGYYLESTPANNIWSDLVAQDDKDVLKTPLGVEYRNESKFGTLSPDEKEKAILNDRLSLIQTLPDSELREILSVFTIQSAIDNLPSLTGPETMVLDLSKITQSALEKATSLQARQRLFEIKLRLDTGRLSCEIDTVFIKNRFPTREEFLAYLTRLIPEKTAYRDSYILLATESYPLKIGDSSKIAELLFSRDYSTTDRTVAMQRGAVEVARGVKKIDKVTQKDIRQLVLWFVDERRQIKSFDDLLVKASETTVGKELIENFIQAANLEGENAEFKGKLLAHGTRKIFPHLPLSVKRKLAHEFLKEAKKRELGGLSKLGMPAIIQEVGFSISSISGWESTFNSLLEASRLENPTGRELFFELMMGNKGLMEEPISTDSVSFTRRLTTGFEGSEMHRFLDDVLEIVFSRGRLDHQARNIARIACHSYIETLGPTKRSTVLYKLLTELPKVDFTEPDKQKLQSRVFSTALSSMGILGAKLAQIDEVIPKGWGNQLASFKHAADPMPRLAIADIFLQESLSPEYVIIDNAGAASTAVGIIIENPLEQRQFTKVIRPDAQLEWKEDFIAVEHMLKCLSATGVLKAESGPLVVQLKRLVENELQTGREVNNVIQYETAETKQDIEERGGIRPVKMPLSRIGINGQPIETFPGSRLIFEELLSPERWTTLAQLKSNPEMSSSIDIKQIHRVIVDDFLYRSLILGNWHADPHDGNIMISKDGVVRRIVKPEDIVYIDFGQVGTADTEIRRENTARLLIGLGLYDRDAVSMSIYNSLADEERAKGTTLEQIKKDLFSFPEAEMVGKNVAPMRRLLEGKFQESVVKTLAKYKVEPYLANFLKATVNILPYMRTLDTKEQFELIAPYIPQDIRDKFRTQLISKLAGEKRA